MAKSNLLKLQKQLPLEPGKNGQPVGIVSLHPLVAAQ
jgi:hypothetical protein